MNYKDHWHLHSCSHIKDHSKLHILEMQSHWDLSSLGKKYHCEHSLDGEDPREIYRDQWVVLIIQSKDSTAQKAKTTGYQEKTPFDTNSIEIEIWQICFFFFVFFYQRTVHFKMYYLMVNKTSSKLCLLCGNIMYHCCSFMFIGLTAAAAAFEGQGGGAGG